MAINFIALGLGVLAKIPIERLFIRQPDLDKKAEALYQQLQTNQTVSPAATPLKQPQDNDATTIVVLPERNQPERVTNKEMTDYQKRELGKQLLLLQIHLEQGCHINGKPCDCCEKHPMIIEALAQETLGITGDPSYGEVAAWSMEIAQYTTEAAVISGKYAHLYPDLAVQARGMRKKIIGTDDIKALLTSKENQDVIDKVNKITTKVVKGEDNERREKTV